MTDMNNKPTSLSKMDYAIWGSGSPARGDPRDGFVREFSKHVLWLCFKKPSGATEIAEELGVSRQGVHDNITRAEAHLANMEAKTGCVRRYLQSRQVMQGILTVANDLKQHTDPAVRDAAAKIIEAASSIEE